MVKKKSIKLDWLKAICPFCSDEYVHLPDYKPSTCGKFKCIRKLFEQATEAGRT